MKYILFPLSNPGKKYENTRHNAGKIVLGFLKKDKSFLNILESENIDIFIGEDFYMNESGKGIRSYIKNKNFQKENLIVMYDDKDLPIGEVRLSINKNDGGHNGLKNIIETLNTKEFYRLRIGIAPKGTGENGVIPPHGEAVQRYVLSNFREEEIEILKSEKVLERIKIYLEEIIKNKRLQ